MTDTPQVHCSLSSFLLGFHVHEKALLVPAVVSALLAVDSRDGARMHLRLSFLATFAAFPLLPGPELRVAKVRSVVGDFTYSSKSFRTSCLYRESRANVSSCLGKEMFRNGRIGATSIDTSSSFPYALRAGREVMP